MDIVVTEKIFYNQGNVFLSYTKYYLSTKIRRNLCLLILELVKSVAFFTKSWFRCTSEHLLLCETKEKVVVMWMLFQSIRLDKNKALAKTFISVLKITVSVSRNNSRLPFNDQTRTSCDPVKFFKAHHSHSQAHYTGWGSFYVINLKKSEHLNWVRTQNTYICFVIKLKSFLSFSLALDTGIH